MENKTDNVNKRTESKQEKIRKYLTFTLANEEYGIHILKVKEIIGIMPITPVPKTPEYVKGVINLRGKVIPITDLRLTFDMDAKEYTDRTCIIVVEITGLATTIQIGIIVDSVSEVLNVNSDDVEKTPSFSTNINTDYILGMAKVNSGVKILLDIDKVLDVNEDIFNMEQTKEVA